MISTVSPLVVLFFFDAAFFDPFFFEAALFGLTFLISDEALLCHPIVFLKGEKRN